MDVALAGIMYEAGRPVATGGSALIHQHWHIIPLPGHFETTLKT